MQHYSHLVMLLVLRVIFTQTAHFTHPLCTSSSQTTESCSALKSTFYKRVAPPTLSHGFDSDDLAGISTARSSHCNNPDAVLTVFAQVGDAVEEYIWGRLKLTAHLEEGGRS